MFKDTADFLAFIVHYQTELAEIRAHFEDDFITEEEARNKIDALYTRWRSFERALYTRWRSFD